MTKKKPKDKAVPAIATEEEIKNKRTAADKNMIAQFREKNDSRSKPPKFKVEQKNSTNQITCDDDDGVLHFVSFMQSFGSISYDFTNLALSELIGAACVNNPDKSLSADHINALVAAMHGINPQDEIEAMLGSQMVAVHFASMRMMRQLKNSDTITRQDSNGNLAIKLLRTYTAQVEALQRYRGKGQQKMTVEHVTVNAGGQAIVGNVNKQEGQTTSTISP